MTNKDIDNSISNVYEFRAALKTLYYKYSKELFDAIENTFSDHSEIQHLKYYPDTLSIYISLRGPAFTYNPDNYTENIKSVIQSFVLRHRDEVQIPQAKQGAFDEFLLTSNLIVDRIVLGSIINFML